MHAGLQAACMRSPNPIYPHQRRSHPAHLWVERPREVVAAVGEDAARLVHDALGAGGGRRVGGAQADEAVYAGGAKVLHEHAPEPAASLREFARQCEGGSASQQLPPSPSRSPPPRSQHATAQIAHPPPTECDRMVMGAPSTSRLSPSRADSTRVRYQSTAGRGASVPLHQLGSVSASALRDQSRRAMGATAAARPRALRVAARSE
jgi:hypothetical protein